MVITLHHRDLATPEAAAADIPQTHAGHPHKTRVRCSITFAHPHQNYNHTLSPIVGQNLKSTLGFELQAQHPPPQPHTPSGLEEGGLGMQGINPVVKPLKATHLQGLHHDCRV